MRQLPVAFQKLFILAEVITFSLIYTQIVSSFGVPLSEGKRETFCTRHLIFRESRKEPDNNILHYS